jgi:hypothetical protein
MCVHGLGLGVASAPGAVERLGATDRRPPAQATQQLELTRERCRFAGLRDAGVAQVHLDLPEAKRRLLGEDTPCPPQATSMRAQLDQL